MGLKFEDGFLIRKCYKCRQEIRIDRENSCRSVSYEGKAYCHDCFQKQMERGAKKGQYAEKWRFVAQNFDRIQKQTDESIKVIWQKDDIYRYIIETYELTNFPAMIFQRLDEIHDGTYKGLVRPIPLDEFFEMWKDYRSELDRIAQGKDLCGSDRVLWDIAVVAQRYDKWKSVKKKERINRQEEIKTAKENTKNIDYNSLYKEEKPEKEFDTSDINALLDAIF